MVPSNRTLLTLTTLITLFFNHITCKHFQATQLSGFEIDINIGATTTTITASVDTSQASVWHAMGFGSLYMNNTIAIIENPGSPLPTFSVRQLGENGGATPDPTGTELDSTASNWIKNVNATTNPIIITLTRNNNIGPPYYTFNPLQSTLDIIYAYGVDTSPTELQYSIGHGPPLEGHWGNTYYAETLNMITTASPTKIPSITPTLFPTQIPSITPSNNPSIPPTLYPSETPSSTPSKSPTIEPTLTPTKPPSRAPTLPTIDPTLDPTRGPTSDTVDPTMAPTQPPSFSPSTAPTHPTYDPTDDPTNDPTTDPTNDPTTDPTFDPTNDPTTDPTFDPTTDPTTDPTYDPTTDPTFDPTLDPTNDPSKDPTMDPTFNPSFQPTVNPTRYPSYDPTWNPTNPPTQPTGDPSNSPTFSPSIAPSHSPTAPPSNAPTSPPSLAPSYAPTYCKKAKFADQVYFGDYLWSDKNESIVSNDCTCRLIMNSNGNLIMLEHDKLKWETDTQIDDYTGEVRAQFGINDDGIIDIKQFAYKGVPSVNLKAITLWKSDNNKIQNVNELILYITNVCCLDLVQEIEDERAIVLWSSCDDGITTTNIITTDNNGDVIITVDAGGSQSGKYKKGEMVWWIWLIIVILILCLIIFCIIAYKRYNDNAMANKKWITSSVIPNVNEGMHGMYGDSVTVDEDCMETDKQIDQWMTGNTNINHENVGETETGNNVEIMYDQVEQNNNSNNSNDNDNSNSAEYQNSIELQANIGDSDSD